LKDFQEGKFWTGDLVIENPKQEVHKLLNTKKASVFGLFNISMMKQGAADQKQYGVSDLHAQR